MSNEISFSHQLSVTQGGFTSTHFVQGSADQTTFGEYSKEQTIPTSDTVIDFTGPTTPGWMQIKNVDATNYVSIGPTSAGAIVKGARLYPGKSASFFIEPGAVWRAQAHTASVPIEYKLLET